MKIPVHASSAWHARAIVLPSGRIRIPIRICICILVRIRWSVLFFLNFPVLFAKTFCIQVTQAWSVCLESASTVLSWNCFVVDVQCTRGTAGFPPQRPVSRTNSICHRSFCCILCADLQAIMERRADPIPHQIAAWAINSDGRGTIETHLPKWKYYFTFFVATNSNNAVGHVFILIV